MTSARLHLLCYRLSRTVVIEHPRQVPRCADGGAMSKLRKAMHGTRMVPQFWAASVKQDRLGWPGLQCQRGPPFVVLACGLWGRSSGSGLSVQLVAKHVRPARQTCSCSGIQGIMIPLLSRSCIAPSLRPRGRSCSGLFPFCSEGRAKHFPSEPSLVANAHHIVFRQMLHRMHQRGLLHHLLRVKKDRRVSCHLQCLCVCVCVRNHFRSSEPNPKLRCCAHDVAVAGCA